MKVFNLIILTLLTVTVIGQSSFSVSVNRDTIYLGNTLELSYQIENIDGQFEGPALDQFSVISGPNTSMSMSIINGVSTKTSTYSYILMPEIADAYIIDEAYCVSSDSTYTSSPISIIVVENPEGIIQEDNRQNMGFGGFFDFSPFGQSRPIPQEKPKNTNKRKMKRI